MGAGLVLFLVMSPEVFASPTGSYPRGCAGDYRVTSALTLDVDRGVRLCNKGMDTFVGWGCAAAYAAMPVPLQKLVTHNVMPLCAPLK